MLFRFDDNRLKCVVANMEALLLHCGKISSVTVSSQIVA